MEVQRADAQHNDPEARAAWVHELRNAFNRIGLHSALAQRLVEKDHPEYALTELADCRRAWNEARELLALATVAVEFGREHAGADRHDATGDVTH
jgi:hypothetical protein